MRRGGSPAGKVDMAEHPHQHQPRDAMGIIGGALLVVSVLIAGAIIFAAV
jgi:hypothetical protein